MLECISLKEIPVIEAIVALPIFLYYFFILWKNVESKETNLEERSLGVSIVSTQMNAMIVSSTILVGILGAFSVAILPDENLRDILGLHVFWSVVFTFLSIILSITSLSFLNYYSAKWNPSRVRSISIIGLASYLFFLFAIVRGLIALYQAVNQ